MLPLILVNIVLYPLIQIIQFGGNLGKVFWLSIYLFAIREVKYKIIKRKINPRFGWPVYIAFISLFKIC